MSPGVTAAVAAGAAVAGLFAGAALPRVVTAFPPHDGETPHLAVPSPRTLALVTAAVCAVLAARAAHPPEAIPAYLLLGVVGVALAVIDLRAHRLPDLLTLPAYPVLLALLGLAALTAGDGSRWLRAVIAGAVTAGFFLLLWLPSGGLGRGDVKLAGVLGLALGWLGWDRVLVGFMAGTLLAAVCAVVLLASRRADRATALPYGPFLLVGALVGVILH